jgi:hypothetical protein
MTNRSNIITTKLLTVAFAIVSVVPVFAHGGFDHVIGTVAGVSGNVLTVKTAKGNVNVKLDEKTEISRGDQKAQSSDLTPGLRVIVDIPEGSKDNIAHSVKLGTAGVASHADHDAHD